jgi:hypothetical protein
MIIKRRSLPSDVGVSSRHTFIGEIREALLNLDMRSPNSAHILEIHEGDPEVGNTGKGVTKQLWSNIRSGLSVKKMQQVADGRYATIRVECVKGRDIVGTNGERFEAFIIRTA